MIATCERMSEDKLKEMDRLFEQMTTTDGLAPEALTYSHLIYGCVGCHTDMLEIVSVESGIGREQTDSVDASWKLPWSLPSSCRCVRG